MEAKRRRWPPRAGPASRKVHRIPGGASPFASLGPDPASSAYAPRPALSTLPATPQAKPQRIAIACFRVYFAPGLAALPAAGGGVTLMLVDVTVTGPDPPPWTTTTGATALPVVSAGGCPECQCMCPGRGS